MIHYIPLEALFHNHTLPTKFRQHFGTSRYQTKITIHKVFALAVVNAPLWVLNDSLLSTSIWQHSLNPSLKRENSGSISGLSEYLFHWILHKSVEEALMFHWRAREAEISAFPHLSYKKTWLGIHKHREIITYTTLQARRQARVGLVGAFRRPKWCPNLRASFPEAIQPFICKKIAENNSLLHSKMMRHIFPSLY